MHLPTVAQTVSLRNASDGRKLTITPLAARASCRPPIRDAQPRVVNDTIAPNVYHGFDAGSLLPSAQVLTQHHTNPTAIEISVVSFGGEATADSGLVGTARFNTTDVLSETTLRVVRAEVGRGDVRENITPSDVGVTLRLAQRTPDFNGDGRVDFGDFVAFGMRFGASRGDARYETKYDLDQDGTIGFGDFLIFGQEFGT